MSSAQRVISKFGSQYKLAEALGTAQTTVAYWAKTGTIPSRWHSEILQAASEAGLSLDASDLVNPPSPSERAERKLPKALYRGELVIADGADAVGCYVLSTGERVISRSSAVAAIAGTPSLGRSGGDLKKYVRPLGQYLRLNIDDEMIEFEIDENANKRSFGITAETFLSICKAFAGARDAGALTTDRQIEMSKRCGAFLAACANVGLIALIDEATGYQYERAEDALRVKLRAFLEEEMRPWEKTFPDELWLEFGRLTGWQGPVNLRPKYWGKLVMELVYGYLDADVADWLRTNAPQPRHGQNYHQWMSSQYGLKKLVEHIWVLIGMASTCTNMMELRYQMAKRYGKEPLQLLMFVDPKSN
jgi:P63C domain